MLIDIHTHKHNQDDTISIYNLIEQNLSVPYIQANQPFSYSLHPWYLNTFTFAEYKKRLLIALQDDYCIAVGECGLDKVRGASLHQQMDWMHEILSLPIHKPIILHCVRAHEELLSVIKQYPHTYIIHGFQKGKELANKYLDRGYSLSLGKSGLDLLSHIGVDASFFLETDTSAWHISEVYGEACKLLKIDLDALITIIETRFRITFATWQKTGKSALN